VDDVINGRPLVPGSASGRALVSREPLSFWGGYDAVTGEIIDRAHHLSGEHGAGRVLVLPFSRGSSTGTAVLLEAIRRGTAPAAIIVGGRDIFFALAAIVAEELYARSLPVVAVDERCLGEFETGDILSIETSGRITRRRE
jgi:predicted aconitase with swiveling domain